jgi:alpha-tubulin suppressor-like RCC1 family protein
MPSRREIVLALAAVGWWACSGPKPDDRLPGDDGGHGGLGARSGSDASHGTGGDLGGGNAGAGAAGGTEGALGGGNGGTDDADAADTGSGGSEAGACPMTPCPVAAPACRNGACQEIIQIATGVSHTCAVIQDGTVVCWGNNGIGQLGEPPGAARTTPGPSLIGPTNVLQLSAGWEHSCAVTRSGAVWCWGYNSHSQLGRVDQPRTPVEVQTLGGEALQVGCHGDTIDLGRGGFTCALLRTGKVRCWGANTHGQLGNGSLFESSATPADVLGLSGIEQIAVGHSAACALTGTKDVYCWGYNLDGRLATGSRADSVTVPARVIGLSDVKMIDGGKDHFCAVVGTTRRVKCWGSDVGGALGDGPPSGNTSRVVVDTGVEPIKEVRAGSRATCALYSSGDVACWGRNAEAEFGNGTMTSRDSVAERTSLMSPTVSLSFRWGTGCALLATRRVQCWGANQGNVGSGRPNGPALIPEDVLW